MKTLSSTGPSPIIGSRLSDKQKAMNCPAEPLRRHRVRRTLLFLVLANLSVWLFWRQYSALLKLALADDRNFNVGLVPIISAGLIYLGQTKIFRDLQYCVKLGLAALASAILLHFTPGRWLSQSASLSVSIFALVLAWTASFVLCYGTRALRSAGFPFLFLLLMVPAPLSLVQGISYVLQVTSADLSQVLFRLLGIPIFREGFVFSLPGQTIEIAAQCSGIRSGVGFFITGLLMGHLFLRSGWRKFALVVISILVSIFKNAIRIVVLSSAGRYLGVDLLNSSLHHQYGGTVFSLLGLCIVVPVLLLLRRGERLALPGASRSTK